MKLQRNRSKARLEEEIVSKLQEVQDAASDKMSAGESDDGIRLFEKAWQMLPEPKLDWDYAVSILRNLCIACIDAGKFEAGKKWHDKLLKAPFADMDSDPYELGGTIYYHLGDLEKAFEFLKMDIEVGGKRNLKLLEPEIRKFYLDRISKD